ncbi:putative 2og-fe oxygenase superfamily protein [Phaeoacremonium minimum UCRPA7]|uniref:Putative 2og-fe oxygenase superfamily protein n=1 Tax=Phaeoacremonium minimum (strain UCR-PA7) TaxID=1286976 RepID=R8BLN9_PHAM7|nr:putative 2og-fe oxygenase superfamily protein [Phaeoacremonium minimum UCRPA7]EOO00264.1 putative 2og-fe oxygenase superfamily protein [Phaeoacremonium minimum UCRPA7]
MSATQTISASAGYTKLRLSSGNGPVYRNVLPTPLRDADPSEIPIIDVSGISSSSLADRAAVAREIHNAATNNGFFYVTNHGIPTATTDSACAACLDFFRQPSDIKDRANSSQSRYFNGYKPPKSQRINPSESIDVRETFSWTYDPRFDPAVSDVSAIPREIAEYMRCEDFPWDATANIPHFRQAIVQYWQSCLALARGLVRSFALSLSLPEDYFDEKFSHPDASLALNYYPPIPATSSPSNEVSIGSHTDFQLFTILWQDKNGGLQVLNRQGQWINAAPIPGTLVVNIGDYLQRITNDKYVSTVHRAQNFSGKERISMPFFFGFNLNESCGVLDGCLAEGEEKKYDEISCVDWVRRRVQAMHETESDDDEESTKKI